MLQKMMRSTTSPHCTRGVTKTAATFTPSATVIALLTCCTFLLHSTLSALFSQKLLHVAMRPLLHPSCSTAPPSIYVHWRRDAKPWICDCRTKASLCMHINISAPQFASHSKILFIQTSSPSLLIHCTFACYTTHCILASLDKRASPDNAGIPLLHHKPNCQTLPPRHSISPTSHTLRRLLLFDRTICWWLRLVIMRNCTLTSQLTSVSASHARIYQCTCVSWPAAATHRDILTISPPDCKRSLRIKRHFAI